MNINVTLIAQVIVFILLVLFTMKFVWPPIVKALDERANKIAEGLSAAERGKADLEKAEKKAEEVLAKHINRFQRRLPALIREPALFAKKPKKWRKKRLNLF